ncbi:MAG: hypothetical protein AAF557_12890 [Pseudomonadota bacterium]
MKLGMIWLCAPVMALVLVGCDGVRGASQYTKRKALEASFEQRSLVDPATSPNRVLTMYVFTGGNAVKNGYQVRFTASVE